jgi:hypothetical protein
MRYSDAACFQADDASISGGAGTRLQDSSLVGMRDCLEQLRAMEMQFMVVQCLSGIATNVVCSLRLNFGQRSFHAHTESSVVAHLFLRCDPDSTARE